MVELKRRRLLQALAWLGAGMGAGAGAAAAAARTQDGVPVRVYLIPLDDFPEALAGTMAQRLQDELEIRIRPSLRLPPLDVPTLPGTRQLVAETLLVRAVAASSRLPELTPATYRVFLTTRDINGESGALRFNFATHMQSLQSSVVSMARLVDYGTAAVEPDVRTQALERMHKMVKRAIGELHLGWRRSTDPADLMYAPLMSVDDIDRLGNEHREPGGASPSDCPPGRCV